MEKVVKWLIEAEEETIESLQAAIEPTGREGVSEALEHLLEHLILRKQNQVDFLLRASRRPEPPPRRSIGSARQSN